MRQLIEGKLESKRHMEATNVQVIIQEEQRVESKLTLLDDSGVFLTTPPVVLSRRESESEMEALQEALAEANQQNSELSDELANTVQNLEEEKAETARLTEELAHVPTEASSTMETEKQNVERGTRGGKGVVQENVAPDVQAKP